ncbi:glycerate kinase [Streptococcus gallolyticus]|nr:glycerate kinase [Streptococcus gallolyticus]MBY5040904.1 glycerate kinase [Streptococcus gallolyticus]
MRVLVAIDSFKGSATSSELNQAVKEGLMAAVPDMQVDTVAIADGGEGTLESLYQALSGEFVTLEAPDLLGNPREVTYLLSENRAFIETASLLGIDKISPSPETFEQASSAGLANLVLDALGRGCQQIFLTLGGTGTSDGGRGFLEKLTGQTVLFEQVELIGLTDVRNPYAGPDGYARIFGPQKGGSPEQIEREDARALAFVEKIRVEQGLDLQAQAGSGAAGGLGGAILLLGGRLQSGFASIADLIGLEEKLVQADVVITGEGHLDRQSFQGKVPVSLVRLAKKYHCPTIALCGAIGEADLSIYADFQAVFSIQTRVQSLSEAMEKETTLENIRFVAGNIGRMIRMK